MKTLKIKQVIAGSILAVALVSLPCRAVTIAEIPNPRKVNSGWVTDMADILSDNTEAKLNQMISELEAKNGTEIAVVTVEDTSPSDSPKQFATALFNYWGIGKKEVNNGILFLISVSDRRVEIETGYGIETILPNAKVAKIIDTKIIPHFQQENFDEGTLDGVRSLIAELNQNPHRSSQKLLATVFVCSLLIGGSAVIIHTLLVGIGILENPKESYSNSSNDRYNNDCVGGGYSGGADFGGGSSDGGGAGGSW